MTREGQSMTTAADIRARVRTRLEETTAAVWTDTELDECVTGALETYGHRFPTEAVTTTAVADGVLFVPAPTGALTIQRVILADGAVVPRRSAPLRATANEEQAWELFADQLRFTQPLDAQTLTIWHTTAPSLTDLPTSDEGLVVLGAVAQALQARAIQDYKRGQPSLLGDNVIANARADFERALALRARRIRGGMVATI